MNWDAIGAIGEIVGAVAVVLSLIYLASQIKMSNSVAQRDSRTKLLEFSKDIWSETSSSPALTKVRVKLRKRNVELNAEETEIALDWAHRVFFTIAAVGISYDSNIVGETTSKTYLLGISDFIHDYPGTIPFLKKLIRSNGVEKGFNTWWDQVLEILDSNQLPQGGDDET